MKDFRPSVDKFSDSYYLFSNARVIPHGGDYTIMARDTYDDLNGMLDEPLLRVSGEHLWPKPEGAVPPDAVAIPRRFLDNGSDEQVLVAKNKTQAQLVENGVVEPHGARQ